MNVTSMDLSLAWSRVRYDIVDRRTFVQRPGEISLVEIDAPGLLRALEAALAADAHSATRPLMSEVPKGKGGVRPGPWLTIEDRIIYYAAVGACLPAIHGELSWAQGTVDFGYQLATDPVRPKWLKRNAQSWASFQAQSIELANSAAWVVLADITAFYESVDHNTLLSQLREAGAPPEATRLLDRLLRQWSSAGRGIPQGLSASDILGKFYLNRVDRRLHDHEQLRSVRWVDDMRIFSLFGHSGG